MVTNPTIVLGSKPKSKGSVLKTISNLALKPSVFLGNLATAGLEKATGKKFGRTKSEELAETEAGKALGLGIATAGLALSAVVAPVATARTLAIPTTVAILAPETTKKVLSTPGAGEIIVAGAVAGAPGAIAVASEKGVSLLETALGKAPEVIRENAPEIAGALAVAGAGVAVAVGGNEILEKAKETFAGSPEIPEIPKATGSPTLTPAPASEVMGGDFPPYPEASTGEAPKRRRKGSKRKPESIRQTVNVYCAPTKKLKRRCA